LSLPCDTTAISGSMRSTKSAAEPLFAPLVIDVEHVDLGAFGREEICDGRLDFRVRGAVASPDEVRRRSMFEADLADAEADASFVLCIYFRNPGRAAPDEAVRRKCAHRRSAAQIDRERFDAGPVEKRDASSLREGHRTVLDVGRACGRVIVATVYEGVDAQVVSVADLLPVGVRVRLSVPVNQAIAIIVTGACLGLHRVLGRSCGRERVADP
jgi:hypothetical protein